MTKSKSSLTLTLITMIIVAALIGGCCAWCKSKCVGTCCMPDLTVTNAEFNPAGRTVSVAVKNIGSASAGEFLVYVEINQPNAPDSAKPESQYSHMVSGLARGVEISIPDIPLSSFDSRPSIDLSILMHGDLEVIADAKDMVKECDESNNRSEESF